MKKGVTLLAVFALLFCVLTVLAPQVANADTGPKPSVNITFEHMGDELCYVTLLSKYQSSGPHTAFDGDETDKRHVLRNYDGNYRDDNPDYHNEQLESVWQAFVDYRDKDGYYFLQRWWTLNSLNNSFNWGYYAPSDFKILIYNPASQSFVTSEAYTRYAFKSYFTVDMSDVDVSVTSTTAQLFAKRSYNYTWEIISLLIRIAITVGIEIAIALLFRIKGRKPLLTVLTVNLVTQIALNVGLNLLNYFDGYMMIIFLYLPLELAVIFVEAVAYSIFLRKQGVPVWKSLVYALVANIASGGLGFLLARFIPGIF